MNVKNAGGARLNSNFEIFTVGLHGENGRSMEHFNFDSEDRWNVVNTPSVTSKLKHPGDRRVINIYQKPRALLDWIVRHFSNPKDWVVDLCSGSGTGLASSLALGRNCISVEIDKRQADVLKGRILALNVNVSDDNDKDLHPVSEEQQLLNMAQLPVSDQSGEAVVGGAAVEVEISADKAVDVEIVAAGAVDVENPPAGDLDEEIAEAMAGDVELTEAERDDEAEFADIVKD